MKVVMTCRLYTLGGFSVVVDNLSAQLTKRGVEVALAAAVFRKEPPVGVERISMPMTWMLPRIERFRKFDIIHNHQPLLNHLAPLVQRPFVYHHYGAPSFLSRLPMIASIETVGRFIDTVITVSEFGARELSHFIISEKVKIVYSGVDTSRFKPCRDERFRRGEPQLLFVGNLYKHKNTEELITIMRRVLKSYPKAHLQIVGEGFAYGSLRRMIDSFDLTEHVEMLGSVSDDDLPNYYSSSDLYITASRWELFGLPLLEAMACARPIVASDIPAHEELLSKSRAGLSFPLGDVEIAASRISKAFENRSEFGERGRAFASEHTWEIAAQEVLEVYKHLI